MKTNKNQVKKTLSALHQKPDPNWINKISRDLHDISKKDVTILNGSRNNSRDSLFYLFKLYIMKVQGKLAITLASLAIVFGGATTVAFASDDAVPGDLLYPVDRTLEKLVGVFKLSDKAKADYQVSILEERIDEYASLDENDDSAVKAAEEIEQQQLKAEERVRELVKTNQDTDNDAAREEIQNRYELQEQKAYEIKEQVQNQNKNKDETTAPGISNDTNGQASNSNKTK